MGATCACRGQNWVGGVGMGLGEVASERTDGWEGKGFANQIKMRNFSFQWMA